MNAFEQATCADTSEGLTALTLNMLQVNVGLLCNQSCVHCHVKASPKRTESMTDAIMDQVIDIAAAVRPQYVDITGGAPEMHPNLQSFITRLRDIDIPVQVRTNFTVLTLPDKADYPEFFRDHKVHLVGSMPCYLEENVDAQRGVGVYAQSIDAIKMLNAVGYGIEEDLPLNLVYNPGGPVLPPAQETLEADYRRELKHRFGIEFTKLLTITNMPIGRFQQTLKKANQLDAYRKLLHDSFNQDTVEGLMCRHQISIAWDGTFYDCDFNLALGMPLNHGGPAHIDQFNLKEILKRRIVTADHCFGCTAGHGSSCSGALD